MDRVMKVTNYSFIDYECGVAPDSALKAFLICRTALKRAPTR